MSFLANELSLEGQYNDMGEVQEAIGRMMRVRAVARRFGHEIGCSRGIANTPVMRGQTLWQLVGRLGFEERRALIQWLARQGPFWDEERQHSPDDFISCRDAVVTDSSLAEAAYCLQIGIECGVISFVPSSWSFTPLTVCCQTDDRVSWESRVSNFWEPKELESALLTAPPPYSTWKTLSEACVNRFQNLSFASDAFDPLRGHPYIRAAADRIVELLSILDRFAGCFDDLGQRTAEGQELYQLHFTGDTAHFSDSSASEKSDFAAALRFRHPTTEGATVACTWHGKVSTGQHRIHFSWPVRAKERPYVAYIGPKITRR